MMQYKDKMADILKGRLIKLNKTKYHKNLYRKFP